MWYYYFLSYLFGTVSIYCLIRFFPDNKISTSCIYRKGTGETMVAMFKGKCNEKTVLRCTFDGYKGGGHILTAVPAPKAKFARVTSVKKINGNEFRYSIEYWKK